MDTIRRAGYFHRRRKNFKRAAPDTGIRDGSYKWNVFSDRTGRYSSSKYGREATKRTGAPGT